MYRQLDRRIPENQVCTHSFSHYFLPDHRRCTYYFHTAARDQVLDWLRECTCIQTAVYLCAIIYHMGHSRLGFWWTILPTEQPIMQTRLLIIFNWPYIFKDVINSYVVVGKSMEEVLCMYYTIEMLYMLETLHSVGIIHGDFKPDNLLIQYPP